LFFGGTLVIFRLFAGFEKFLFDIGFFGGQEFAQNFITSFQRKKRQSGEQNQPTGNNDQEVEELEGEQGVRREEA